MIFKATDALYLTILGSSATPIIDTHASFQDPDKPLDRQLATIRDIGVPTEILARPGSGFTRAMPELSIKCHNSSVGLTDVLVLYWNGPASAYHGLFQATMSAGDSITYQKGAGFKVNCVGLMGTNLATIISNALPPGVNIVDILRQLPVFADVLLPG